MKLPTLYKRTNTGAIQFWDIQAEDDMSSSVIKTTYGQLGTDSPQVTKDRISEGKNPGKKNATTHFEQASKEANAKWQKQKKKGYVESKSDAEAGKLDDLIEGGEEPMLAEAYMDIIYDQRNGHENDPPTYLRTKESKKVKFPCFGQPKLDGIRCVAILRNGKCTLWSRTRKPINSVPHISREIETKFKSDITLDGELYNHEMKADFEKIVSLVRQKEPGEGHESVQYHIYDTMNGDSFQERYSTLGYLFSTFLSKILHLVHTGTLSDEKEAILACEENVRCGYEGVMLRNISSTYIKKRSMDLQKIKPFIDAEFPIVNAQEGRGTMSGKAIFTCIARNGKPFDVKMKGELESLRKYLEDESTWKDKELTVRYQGLTGAEKVPRFPVGLAIRDYE